MNSSLSKLAPNLSHDNIFTALPIWSLSRNQICFLFKTADLENYTVSAGERGEVFGKKMKEMWIQNGSIKSLSGDLRNDNVLLHKKNPADKQIMDSYVKANDI